MTNETADLVDLKVQCSAAWEAWQEASAEYDNTFQERVDEARAVIRGELKPLHEKREAAYTAWRKANEQVKAAEGVKAPADLLERR